MKKSTSKSASKEERVVKRSGSTKRLDGVPHYPKRYEVVIEKGADKTVLITRRSENMTCWELYGLLRMLLLEIERQMLIKPDEELKLP